MIQATINTCKKNSDSNGKELSVTIRDYEINVERGGFFPPVVSINGIGSHNQTYSKSSPEYREEFRISFGIDDLNKIFNELVINDLIQFMDFKALSDAQNSLLEAQKHLNVFVELLKPNKDSV